MYELTRYDQYNYKQLSFIKTLKRRCKDRTEIYNNIVCMFDTETSKKSSDTIAENHVVAFTVSIRAHGTNICTLYGNKPSECIDCMTKIIEAMQGEKTIFYAHNLAYDYTFLRRFMFLRWGNPIKALNTKPHYPIVIEFENGIILKDSLILAQKSLDKWAKDMNVEHQKATGKWNYDLIRNQNDHEFTADELEYIEHDTLAGVECIDKLKEQLHHFIYSMPYTATGIVREEARKIGKQNYAHDFFRHTAPSFEVYQLLEQCFHGGFTHANRYIIGEIIKGKIECYDFKSSYPFVILTEKFPLRTFKPFRKCCINDIISMADKYGFILKLIMINPRIKNNDVVMPVLQVSKCTKTINMVADNGRILCASYIEIYVTEISLKLIVEQYDFDSHVCVDTYYSRKGYLPRWFTDYVFKLFKDKCELDGVDPLNYILSKAKLNSCYGMCVQKAIADDISEDYATGEYSRSSNYDAENYEKYVNNRNKFLPFQWGCWVTEFAMYNLHTVGKMCKHWLYSDTDSVFGLHFNKKQLKAYNDECLKKLQANGYDSVVVNGRKFTLGVAELDKVASEFVTQGAKRYCYRSSEDQELHITVAGVPKKGVDCLNNDINNFQKGIIFDGKRTGKKQHTYFYNDIFIDKNGNETGDSIDLSACDYLLDDIEVLDWEKIFEEEISIQTYELD